MWIRSQNKKLLINTEDIYVVRGCVKSGDKDATLGEYYSEEKAIEVLEQVQNALFQGMKTDYITKGGVRHYRDKVFEMPQK